VSEIAEAIAASIAFPPWAIMFNPACDASG